MSRPGNDDADQAKPIADDDCAGEPSSYYYDDSTGYEIYREEEDADQDPPAEPGDEREAEV